MAQAFLEHLDRLLAAEELLVNELKQTQAARKLSSGRKRLLEHLRRLAQSDDIPLIIATEKAIIRGDLSRYANSAAMVGSLNAAMQGMDIVEHHLILLADKEKYSIIDQAHRMGKHRRAGLPFDEARQALMNLDKSRLDEDEKQVIDMRKMVMAHASECYARRQAATLGIDPAQG